MLRIAQRGGRFLPWVLAVVAATALGAWSFTALAQAAAGDLEPRTDHPAGNRQRGRGIQPAAQQNHRASCHRVSVRDRAVSYTHLTLPTIYSV